MTRMDITQDTQNKNITVDTRESNLAHISWGKVEEMCKTISSQIKNSNFKPDILLGLSRGGLVPARIFSDLLNTNKVHILRVKSYNIDKKISKPVIDDYKCEFNFKGKKILVVDDITDTGESLDVVKRYLAKKGLNPKNVKFATLHYKPNSRFKPDYFADVTEKWIVYPWEKEEMRRKYKNKI